VDLNEHVLLAVIPPGSIEREVSALQNALFSARGCLSAAALPPLVPVAFLKDGASLRLADFSGAAADGGMRHGLPLRTTGWARKDGWLFLSLEPNGAWEARVRAIEEALAPAILHDAPAGEQAAGPFPLHQGFFMGCSPAEGGGGAESVLQAPLLSFSSCSLALIRLRVSAGEGGWWREVYTEIVEKKPLR
jgi:hypothetical protein